jgi:tumor necrosis factor receptor superfamily protein 21
MKLENSTLLTVEPSPLDKNKGFFVDESEPLLRCDSTSSGSSALSRTGSFITKGTTVGYLPQNSPWGFTLASSTF